MPTHPCRTIAAALTLSSLAHAGGLQNGWKSFRDPTIQDHSYEWSKVGHARNADWVGLAPPFGPVVRVGGVDYRYRIAKTEVTNRQWYEFVLAYAPHVSSQFSGSSQFTGRGVGLSGGGGYSLAQETADHGAEVGWRFAARYVNWLHNGKVNDSWAFESGVYDTSTFGDVPNSTQITDQRERSEGARYFLPTLDEWVKAVHFDRDRHGEGQEGYWLYATTSDTAPIPGAPGAPGAQTNAGTEVSYPVMSFPDVQTPWGLWDASGSVREWLETMPGNAARLVDSANLTFFPPGITYDHIGSWTGNSPASLVGIRLGSIIPAPGASLVALAAALITARSRRR